MNSRIGVEIGARAVRAILLRSGEVAWHSTAPLPDAGRVEETVSAVLATAPRTARRSSVTVVLSSTWVQAKPLAGLPSLETLRSVNELLNNNEHAFFLSTGRPRVLAGVHVDADGTPWGAAFDAAVLEAVVRAVRSVRMRLACVLPLAVGLSVAWPGESITWRDGDDVFSLEALAAELRRARPVLASDASESGPNPTPLRSIGDEAAAYLGAYTAAIAPRRLPLAWRPSASALQARRRRIVASVAMCGALVSAAAFAVLAPNLRAWRESGDSARRLAELAPMRAELLRNESELRRVTGTLDRLAAFAAERGRVTRLLASVSRAIPESTALLTVRVDSLEVAFTAISPRVADVLPTLSAIDDVVAPRIVGSVTREVVGGAHVERAAFRLRRRGTRPSR